MYDDVGDYCCDWSIPEVWEPEMETDDSQFLQRGQWWRGMTEAERDEVELAGASVDEDYRAF